MCIRDRQESAPYVDTGEADSAVAEDAIQEDDGERAYVLYFPNEDYTRLTVEVAYKAAAEGKSREETAIDLLLAGPSSDDLRPVFGEGVKVTRYEQSLDLMNIYFTPELLNKMCIRDSCWIVLQLGDVLLGINDNG